MPSEARWRWRSAALVPLVLLAGCAQADPGRPATVVPVPSHAAAANPPALAGGLESVHAWVNGGTWEQADTLLRGPWRVPRGKPVTLRDTSSLLWAFHHSGRTSYRAKLVEILRTYARAESGEPAGAADRIMILINVYAKLRRSGNLPADLAAALPRSIQRAAAALATEEGDGFATAFARAVALLLVHTNLPALDGSAEFGRVARERLARLLGVGVDVPGLERSPAVHVELLVAARELVDWAGRNHVRIPAAAARWAASLHRYAAQIVWPDGTLPLVGVPVRRAVAAHQSQPPAGRAVLFGRSGQAVLRAPAPVYRDTGQLVFNAGPPGEHRDALALTYYSGGRELLPDSGVSTAAPGPAYTYFRGTSAHNTVVVDGLDQPTGPASAGLTATGDGWAYQSAVLFGYPRVTHRRAVMLLAPDLVLVVDLLAGDRPHRYDQLWHLFPGARLLAAGLEAHAHDGYDNPALSIVQARLAGDPPTVRTYHGALNPMQGWFSAGWGQAEPNHVVSYSTRGASAAFLTLLTAGRPGTIGGTASHESVHAMVCAGGLLSTVDITRPAGRGEAVSVRRGTGCPA